MVFKEHHCPPGDGTDLGCMAALLSLTPRAPHETVLLTPPQLHHAALAQKPHDDILRKDQESQFRQASYSFIPIFFSVSRMLQKSTFLSPSTHRNRIYPLFKPQSTKSTKNFCDCFFPETRLYILPIPTQYHLCSPWVANYCILITKGPVRILQRAHGLLICKK